MRRDSVTYRLGTSGESEVLQTLAKIGEAGEAGAKRAAKAVEREWRTAEAQLDRAKRRAEQIAAMGGSALQRMINTSTGVDRSLGDAKSAEASMRAFMQAQDEAARASARLLSTYDPLFAAQQRYNFAIEEASRLQKLGALTTDQFSTVQARATAELEAVRNAQQRTIASSGAMAAGTQQLGFQISDFAVQMAGGTSAVRAFALQGPQAVQALAMMGMGADKSKSKFAAFSSFLAGPWGAAVTVGASVVGLLATKLLEADDATAKVEWSTSKFSDAQSILGTVIDTTTGKIRTQSSALIALARAQALAGRIEAARMQASARETMGDIRRGGLGDLRISGSMMGLSVSREEKGKDIISAFQTGSLSLEEAERGLRQMYKTGQLTEEAWLNAAQAVTEFGLAGENIKVFEELQKALDGDKSALAGFLTPKPTRGGGRSRGSGKDPEAQRLEENKRLVDSLIGSYDELGAAIARRDEAMKGIERLVAAGPGANGITAEYGNFLKDRVQTEFTNTVFAKEIADGEKARQEREQEAARREKAYETAREDQAANLAMLEREGELIGASAAQREKELSILAYTLDLQRQGVDTESERGRILIENERAQLALAEAQKQQLDMLEEQRRIGEDIIDTLFDPQNWNDWGALGKKILQDLMQDMLRLALINPLKNALFDSGLPVLGGIFGHAAGTEYSDGGWRRVGEFGEELVRLPRGAQVMNANRTREKDRSGTGQAVSISYNVSADGADPAQLRRLTDAFERLNASIERRAVSATLQAHRDTHGLLWQG